MVVLIDPGGPTDIASIPLSTRKGTWIPNEQPPELHPSQMEASIDLWRRHRPSATLRSANSLYNCMGLVFAARRTWVETDHLAMILREDEYRRVRELAMVEIGDLVVYRNQSDQSITHIGIIIEKTPEVRTGQWEITILSKWGRAGEYFHPLHDVPDVFGEPSDYWTDRRKLR